MGNFIIALGSNLGKREEYLKSAVDFLQDLSSQPIKKSALYETEAVGDNCSFDFLNAVVQCQIPLDARSLLKKLKDFEAKQGRNLSAPRWSDRILDMDIISHEDEIIVTESLSLPHPEYHKRLFVLIPLYEIAPEWSDPASGLHISEMIATSDKISVSKTSLNW